MSDKNNEPFTEKVNQIFRENSFSLEGVNSPSTPNSKYLRLMRRGWVPHNAVIESFASGVAKLLQYSRATEADLESELKHLATLQGGPSDKRMTAEEFESSLGTFSDKGDTDTSDALPSFPDEIHKPLREFFRRVNSDSVLRCVSEHVEKLLRILDELAEGKEAGVPTLWLYELISEAFKSFPKIDVLDQAVYRWTELLHPDHAVHASTFNYSNDILSLMVAQARKNPDYRVRRVFVVGEADVSSKDKQRVLREVFLEILDQCKEHEGQLQNRVLWVGGKRNSELRRVISQVCRVEDFVVATTAANDSGFLLREHITFETHQHAKRTSGSIFRRREDILDAQSSFQLIFDAATPLDNKLDWLKPLV